MALYSLLSNLVTLSYIISLMLVAVIALKPRVLNSIFKKAKAPRHYYYIFPALISLFLFLINYYIQVRFFDNLLTANIGLQVYYDAGLDVIQGHNPYERDYLSGYTGGFGYGPVLAVLLGIGLLFYNSPFTVAFIIWAFYLATVLLAVKVALEFFDQRTAFILGLIAALNPLMWHMTIALATTDIFVSLTILIIFYLFVKSGKEKSSATKYMLILGAVTAVLASIKFISLLALGAALLSTARVALNDKIRAILSCGFLFIFIHLAAYNLWGMEMIEVGYVNPYGSSSVQMESPLSLVVDFSLLSLPMDYGLDVTRELFSIYSYQISFTILFLFLILLFSYSIIILRRLTPSAAIVVVLAAFYLGSPLVHVAYFTWLFPTLFLIAFLLEAIRLRVLIPSFFIILIPRLWQSFVEKELGGILSLETQILKTFLISSMAVILLLFLSWTMLKMGEETNIRGTFKEKV